MPTDSDSRKLERIEAALSNLEISADSVNLNTDGLETKLDTANGILTTLSADTALLKTDVADGVTLAGIVGTDAGTPSSNQFVKIGGHQSGSNPTEHIVHVSAGGALKVDGSNSTQPISGTVTALPVNGALNDYSGSITTASTSYNVVGTNASRRYALVQNISDTGMWLNIGAAATTTNSIFLASNSGIVWESGFLPTATLSILCTTSGKRFVVKEI